MEPEFKLRQSGPKACALSSMVSCLSIGLDGKTGVDQVEETQDTFYVGG
jgi:hypothetical protein